MWLNICQGLMLLGWVSRFGGGLFRAFGGQRKLEPTGAVGVVFTVIWCTLSAVVIWRSGALSTIVGPYTCP